MMLRQLRRKFILITMGIVCAMLIVIFCLLFLFTKNNLQTQSLRMLDALSQTDLTSSGSVPQGLDIRLPYFLLQANLFGDLIATGSSSFDPADQAFLDELLASVDTSQSSQGYLEAYDYLYRLTVEPGIRRLVFLDVSSHSSTLRELVKISLFVGLLGLLAFWGMSILLSRWAVKPVEAAWNQQQQFISDASHELKTPLTVIMSNAELLQTADEVNAAQYNRNILAVSQQMRTLVEGLLELARADNGQIRKAFSDVDLSSLVSEAALPFEPLYFEQGLVLAEVVTPGIYLRGNAQYLQQLVDILLDNAQKYTAAGIVHLDLQRFGKNQCLLSVSNPGQPIPQEELEKIFTRFYRTDKARSRSGSFGLGLSIAQSIVTDHGGKIWAESNETGNCFYVLLPCFPAAT